VPRKRGKTDHGGKNKGEEIQMRETSLAGEGTVLASETSTVAMSKVQLRSNQSRRERELKKGGGRIQKEKPEGKENPGLRTFVEDVKVPPNHESG